ncbi:MAG: hypothetical protein JWR72_3127 [Flavisolibacter sp.]|jgi:hypothetical protein|nr:hypothetical protein [Flavisolibacter sp.]
MNIEAIQVQLFQQIKNKTNAASLVDEIAAALNISTDSAYRRIRGEKPVTLEEVYILCSRYQLSLDALLSLKTDAISFQGKFIDPVSFRFEEYIASVLQQVKYMASFKERSMYYLCKDIPLFHHYQFKELAAFKYYFWHKTLLQSPQFVSKKVSLKGYPVELYEAGRKALDVYNQINSYEIWNMESLNGTLRQVEFYHDMQAFQSEDDLLKIYESLESLFTHLETQAELGYKFDSNDPDRKPMARFHMYFNEVVIGDNSILAVLDGSKICFLTHTGFNFIMTRDLPFCENLYSYYQNLMRKSTLISSVSERERSKFFSVLRNRIALRKEKLKVSI